MDELYLIKNNNGLFSTGGYHPTFSKKAKVYNIGSLRQHLANIISTGKLPYDDCNIVAYRESREDNAEFEKYKKKLMMKKLKQ